MKNYEIKKASKESELQEIESWTKKEWNKNNKKGPYCNFNLIKDSFYDKKLYVLINKENKVIAYQFGNFLNGGIFHVKEEERMNGVGRALFNEIKKRNIENKEYILKVKSISLNSKKYWKKIGFKFQDRHASECYGFLKIDNITNKSFKNVNTKDISLKFYYKKEENNTILLEEYKNLIGEEKDNKIVLKHNICFSLEEFKLIYELKKHDFFREHKVFIEIKIDNDIILHKKITDETFEYEYGSNGSININECTNGYYFNQINIL